MSALARHLPVLALGVLALAAAGPAAGAPLETIEGVVAEVSGGPGGTARAVLQRTGLPAAPTLRAATSTLAQELLRLSGLRVRLHAEAGPAELRVHAYEILEVPGGGAPRLGRLVRLEGEGRSPIVFAGDDGRAHPLPSGWQRKLARHVGARIWVLDDMRGSSWQIRRFGILRPAPRGGAPL
jgi:hypothetical protein